MHRRDAPEQQSTATIALLLLPLLWRSCLATALDSFHLSSALDSRPAHGFAAQRPFASSQRKAVNSCYRRAAHHPVSSSDVPAGPWLSQTWATSLYLPTFVGEAVVAPLFGLFVGRFWAHVTDEELWREHTKRYRAFLYAVTALVTVYALLVVEEACYWGSECFSQARRAVCCARLAFDDRRTSAEPADRCSLVLQLYRSAM